MNKFITISIAWLCITTAMAQEKKVTLKFIETTDVHGCFFPYSPTEKKEIPGTMARVSWYVNQLRNTFGNNLILLENGDILQGQPISYYYNYVDTVSENIAAQVVNYLGYDAQVVGNHDVETGHAVYDKWVRETKCPVLGANVINKETESPYWSPYTIIEREGIHIAIIGLLTPAIPNWLEQSLWSGLRFENMKNSISQWIHYIKKHEHPDIIVGLFHSGWDGGIVTDEYREDDTRRIIEEIEDLDLVFFGHDHTPKVFRCDNNRALSQEPSACVKADYVYCINPSNNARYVGEATVTLTLKNNKVTKKEITGQITDIRKMPIDTAYMHHFGKQNDLLRLYTDRQIGTLAKDMFVRDAYFGNSSFIDLIHNLQLSITKADISLNAPLSFDGGLHAGPITIADMFTIYKYENKLYVMRLTGEEIRNHLEMSYDQWVNTMSSPNDHLLLLNNQSANDSQRMGFKNYLFNFDSAAGIDYEVDVTKPNGKKVNILRMSNGQPFDEKKWYRVAVNSYRGNGGGELLTKGAGIPQDSLRSRIVWESEKDQRHYLMKEIERIGTCVPTPNHNWRFVPEEWVLPAIKRDRELLFKDK